jgi:hypothetical protein
MPCMLRAALTRPSVLVVTWTALVVGVFVWRGDLRVAPAAAAPPPAPLAARAPNVVKAPARAAPRSPLLARRGRIFDALGFLVVGAEVVPMHRPALRTDGDGAFVLELAAGDATDLLVRAEGQRPLWVRASEGSPDVLALQLAPMAPWDALPEPPPSLPTLRGEGTARTGDGQPLAGAFVFTSGSGTWVRCDDIGRFAATLATPTSTLFVHAPFGGVGGHGFAGASEPLVSERTRGVVPVPDVVAAPALAIRGVVRDAHGEPVVGNPVEVVGASLRRVVDTGGGGQFAVGGLPAGTYVARPFAFRGDLGVATEVNLRDGAVDVDLQLVAADEVRLRVVDERGGPVAGVYVASSIGGTRRGVAQADADGYAAVPVGAATEFDVRAAEHFTPVTVRRYQPEPATIVVAAP